MADFNGTILTNAGRDILTKALAGAKLTFSRIGIGDGVWDDGANPEQMVALKDEKKSLPIQELSVVGDGTTRLRFVLTNSGLTEGFFVREIGIFALDPDTQEEKLYAVAYAENPDFIPSDGVTKVESVVDIYTVVSTAQSVTAVISDTVVLATKDDIKQHNESTSSHSDIRAKIDTHISQTDAHNIPGQISAAIDSLKSEIGTPVKRYEHTQDTAASLWTVEHNLNSLATPIVRTYQTSTEQIYLDGYCGSGVTCGSGATCGSGTSVDALTLSELSFTKVVLVSKDKLNIEFSSDVSGKAIIMM